MSNFFRKYVSEVETFAIDWTNYLANANNGAADTISTATWTTETGITKDADSVDGDNDRTLIRLSGGTAGSKYTCQCKITLTSGSDTPIRFITIQVDADPVSV